MSTASDSSEYHPQPQPQPHNVGPVKISQSIHRIYKSLLKHPDLSPSPEVNATFSELVDLCIQPHDVKCVAAILNDKRVAKLSAHLRSICSMGEFKLESYWAEKIVKGTNQSETEKLLLSFPYYNNYVDLARLEISALSAAHPQPIKSLCFIGSGPMPMTSLCFSRQLTPPPRIHNIDCDPHAIAISSQLCKNLGTKNMTFQLGNAAEIKDFSAFDVVFLAGLVGDTKEVKMHIMSRVVARCRPGALVVLRSAHGLRKLLYQEIDVGCLRQFGLEVLLVVHPWDHVVNSVVVCRVLGREKARL